MFLVVFVRLVNGVILLNYDFFCKKICIIGEKVVSLRAN